MWRKHWCVSRIPTPPRMSRVVRAQPLDPIPNARSDLEISRRKQFVERVEIDALKGSRGLQFVRVYAVP